MIRRAYPDDVPDLVSLAVEALSIDPYENLKLDRNRIYQVVRTCVFSERNFSWVSSKNGVLQGALGALVTPHAFYEGNMAMVVMWYSKNPGDGAKLMKKFISWCQENPGINYVEYTGERNADPRVGALVKRLGFNQQLPVYQILR